MIQIKAIIFDYGGVIGNNPNDYIYKAVSRAFKLDRNIIKKEFFKFIFRLTKGEIAENIFWKKIAKNLNTVNYIELKEVWLKEFRRRAKINKNVLGLIKKLKKRYKLCLLSNNAVFFQTPQSSKIMKKNFDLLVYSFNVKMRKPEKRIYLYTIKKLKCNPEECLIIDDDKAKLLFPRKIGMRTIHFKSFLQLKKSLEKQLKILL